MKQLLKLNAAYEAVMSAIKNRDITGEIEEAFNTYVELLGENETVPCAIQGGYKVYIIIRQTFWKEYKTGVDENGNAWVEIPDKYLNERHGEIFGILPFPDEFYNVTKGEKGKEFLAVLESQINDYTNYRICFEQYVKTGGVFVKMNIENDSEYLISDVYFCAMYNNTFFVWSLSLESGLIRSLNTGAY